MKNLLIALAILLVPTTALASFVDYGKDANGHQCFDQKDEDGQCDLVYSDDYSLVGDRGFDTAMSAVIAQPNSPTNSERVARQKEVRRQICMILGC